MAFDKAISAVSRVAAWLAAIILVGITAVIVLEIFMRNVVGRSTFVAEEFVSYGLAALVFLGLSHAFDDGKLIRVDLILGRLPIRARRAVEFALVIATLATMLFILQLVWDSVHRYWRFGTTSWTGSGMPRWFPEAVVLAGIVLFCLQLLAYVVRIVRGGPLIAEPEIDDAA